MDGKGEDTLIDGNVDDVFGFDQAIGPCQLLKS